MFLVNASPLVALQTNWEPFAQSRSCGFPVCFSESEEDVTRASVNAKVQMIINNLHSQESSLGMNNEYDCIMQKNQKGEKGSTKRLMSNTCLLQEHIKYSKQDCPDDSDGTEMEESSEFGALVLDSDSDDSVDRDIEEAIQEYLKTKSKGNQLLPRNAQCLENTDGDKRVRKELSQSKVANNLPMKFEAEMVAEELVSDHMEISKKTRSASPLSISSDDSFEQSIQAEIVQFLNEKKQQETNKCVIMEDRKLEWRETHVKSVLKYNKETTNKANCPNIKQGCKALLLRHHRKLRKASSQYKCLKSRTSEEPIDFSQVNQAHLKMTAVSEPWSMEQNKGSEAKRNFWREEQIIESAHISDSSSDDGIEEAIQLYQLEKIRKQGSRPTDHVPSGGEQFDAKGAADISARLTISSAKSISPDIHKKTLSNKRKEMGTKSMELKSTGSDLNQIFKPVKKARGCASPVNKIADCELTLQASCRADTSAELMCAEAILDISKTILPPPVGSDNRPLAASPFFSSQSVPPAPSESDSSPIDSDDSIEQEIRAFLAVKGQSESLVPKPSNLSHAICLPSSSEHHNLTAGFEPSLPKTFKLSLSRKRRLRGESKVAKQTTPKKPKEVETGCSQLGNNNNSQMPVFQNECGLSSHREACEVGRCGNKEIKGQLISWELTGHDDEHVALDSATTLVQVHQNAKELLKSAIQSQERDDSSDKSSSLDSDEDLDSAIKDLLKSKRKLKKKSKDQKIQCRKKVRFSDMEIQVLDELGSVQPSEWESKSPPLLKCSLSKSRRETKENEMRNLQSSINGRLPKGRPENIKSLQCELQADREGKPKPVCNQNNLQAAKTTRCPLSAPSVADDSSSVDSDDSIEQEIRKFLAEKAKDPVSNMGMQKDKGTTDLLRVAKPSTNKGKARLQLLETETGLISAQGRKTKKALQQSGGLRSSRGAEGKSAIMHDGGKSVSFAENMCFHTTVELKAKQGRAGTQGDVRGGSSAKQNAAGKKDLSSSKPMQKSFPAKNSRGDPSKLHNCLKAKPNSKRKSTFQLKISSKFIASLKYARERKRSELLKRRQNAESSLPLSSPSETEVAPPSGCELRPDSEAVLQKENCDREEKTGSKYATFPQKLTIEEINLPVAEICEKPEASPLQVRAEADNYRKDKTLRDEEMNLIPDPGPPPLQGPSTAAVKDDSVSTDICSSESQTMHIKEEERESLPRNNSQEESDSSSEGKMLVQQNGECECKENQDEEALNRGDAEFSDVAIEECPRSLVKTKLSTFMLKTSIDPGLTMQPYIILSPRDLCKNLTLKTQKGKRKFQEKMWKW
ncbi:PREDICTED: protein phosphatase 1 regulatory subunit 26 isoform X1 [Gavialis gangeticus]|uniref:protein phosphatase 1 regulatory subunit 26 isoform X1 n=1 Tax=Gavialis gangeticus TaxID=94835 RepID=UPI00092EC758|nr:PREDICTED: protein phosphatase 1 regulatory subunit 26 isoform X1 [Gavialis gangeticus]